jgi:hypothetical protein
MELNTIPKGWQLRSRKVTGLLDASDLGKVVTSGATAAAYILPTMANLGQTDTPDRSLVVAFQRGGIGTWQVFVQPGVVINWNGINPQLLPKDHGPVVLMSTGVDTWAAS